MQPKTRPFQKTIVLISAVVVFFLLCAVAQARVVTQIMPTLIISEEYSDNYFQDSDNEQEEFITSVGLGFSVGFIERKYEVYLNYNPEYLYYKNLDDRDGLEHNASLDGAFRLTKKTNLDTQLAYTTRDDKLAGESWENSAYAALDTLLTKHTSAYISQSYTNSFNQQIRTGDYNERNVNRTAAGITNQFGERDRMGLNFSYEFVDYNDPDADEYTEYSPSAFITYWMTPLNGIDSNVSYEKTDFDNASNDIDTYRGDIRYIRSFSRHVNGYVKYRHTYSEYSERGLGEHHIFHPSVGFDWEVTEDSGISLGIGVLFSRWDNSVNDDSTDPFLDLNAYKTFNFSRRGSLAFTGSSGYGEYNEDAASLGYSIYYQAGARLNYQLLKRLSSNLFVSYQRDEFSDNIAEGDRTDNTINIGGGLSWTALRWLYFDLTLAHTDFSTDADQRGDYKENTAFLSVRLVPAQPVRLKSESDPTRQDLENTLFR
ncbi:MAG: outer membrane beta-barrel protein [Desulfotignum sp.]